MASENDLATAPMIAVSTIQDCIEVQCLQIFEATGEAYDLYNGFHALLAHNRPLRR